MGIESAFMRTVGGHKEGMRADRGESLEGGSSSLGPEKSRNFFLIGSLLVCRHWILKPAFEASISERAALPQLSESRRTAEPLLAWL